MLRQLLIICALLLAAACHRQAPTSKPGDTSPARGGSFTVTVRSKPSTFNRFAPGGNQSAVDALTRLTHASLIRLNRATREYEPWLAGKWGTSPDNPAFPPTLRHARPFSHPLP